MSYTPRSIQHESIVDGLLLKQANNGHYGSSVVDNGDTTIIFCTTVTYFVHYSETYGYRVDVQHVQPIMTLGSVRLSDSIDLDVLEPMNAQAFGI